MSFISLTDIIEFKGFIHFINTQKTLLSTINKTFKKC